MRFLTITILCCLTSVLLFSQTLEITTSFGQNTFYKIKEPPNFESYTYSSGNAFSANLRLKLTSENFPTGELLVFCAVEQYQGGFNYQLIGNGISSSVIGHTEKTMLSLGLYPLNFKILKRVDAHVGVQMALLLNENNKGQRIDRNSFTTPTVFYSSLKNENINVRNGPALNIKLSYPVKINENLSILPEYMGVIGLISELKRLGFPRSMRNYLGVGLSVKL